MKRMKLNVVQEQNSLNAQVQVAKIRVALSLNIKYYVLCANCVPALSRELDTP